MVVGAVSLVLGGRASSAPASGFAVATLSGICGAVGMATFYLALDHGKASSVVPVIGVYPAFVALLAVAFLSDRLSAMQALGVLLAVAGVILVGTGGQSGPPPRDSAPRTTRRCWYGPPRPMSDWRARGAEEYPA